MENFVFLKDWTSKLESKVLNSALSLLVKNSKYIVNPIRHSLVGKYIILNLPIELRLGKLSIFNKIISRFPINGVDYELIPYELPKEKISINEKDYSLLILNKEMISELDNINVIEDTNFLLGTDSHIDGYLTSIGYKLVSTDLDKFK